MGFVIGIGGVSRSGKSFLASSLAERLSPDDCIILSQDNFVFPEEKIPRIRDHVDWEVPESIDFDRLIRAVQSRSERAAWVIVEGLLAFWDPRLYELFDYRIFITLSKETFMIRKPTDLRWGAEPEWYVRYIWDCYQVYGQYPEGSEPHLVLDGELDFDLDGITRMLQEKVM